MQNDLSLRWFPYVHRDVFEPWDLNKNNPNPTDNELRQLRPKKHTLLSFFSSRPPVKPVKLSVSFPSRVSSCHSKYCRAAISGFMCLELQTFQVPPGATKLPLIGWRHDMPMRIRATRSMAWEDVENNMKAGLPNKFKKPRRFTKEKTLDSI